MKKVIALLIGVILAIIVYFFFFTPYHRQARKLEKLKNYQQLQIDTLVQKMTLSRLRAEAVKGSIEAAKRKSRVPEIPKDPNGS